MASFIGVILMLGSFICFIISNIELRVIGQKKLYPKNFNHLKRPKGLNIKELKQLLDRLSDPFVKRKIRNGIRLRKLGFFLLASVFSFLLIINPIIQVLLRRYL